MSSDNLAKRFDEIHEGIFSDSNNYSPLQSVGWHGNRGSTLLVTDVQIMDAFQSASGSVLAPGVDGSSLTVLDFSKVSLDLTINASTGLAIDVGGTKFLELVPGGSIKSINGGSGDDTIIGDDQDNWISGMEGDDHIDGGDGQDTAVFQGAQSDYQIITRSGVATIINLNGPYGTDTLLNMEYLQFDDGGFSIPPFDSGPNPKPIDDDGPSNPNDNNIVHIRGSFARDVINGSASHDYVHGLGGSDLIAGANGDDVIYGGRGFDVLLGGDGNDSLIGGRNLDHLFGGSGADAFVFNSVASSTPSEPDVIEDFISGTDVIDLQGLNAFIGGKIDLSHSFLVEGLTGLAGQLAVAATQDGIALSLDVDGDAIADFTIEFVGIQSLSQADIVI